MNNIDTCERCGNILTPIYFKAKYKNKWRYEVDYLLCEKCGSKRISICKGIEISIEENLSTGKVLSRSKSGTTIFWIYKCRKCGWLSETCSE